MHPLAGGLSWAQYRRVRVSPDGFQASTGFRLAYHAVFRESGGVASASGITTTLSIDPMTTWVVSSAIRPVRSGQTDALFEHERLHWRIDILVGRELDAALHAVGTAASMTDLRTAMDTLTTQKVQREQDISDAYDDETRHGVEAGPQAQWIARVRAWEGAGRIAWP